MKTEYTDQGSDFLPFSDKETRKMDAKLKKIEKQCRLIEYQTLAERLARMVDEMRAKEYSEPTIRRLLPSLYEYLKPAPKPRPNPLDKLALTAEPEELDEPDPGDAGILLSAIQTRQLTWLWPNRIPMGKITILDGDPAMGKSLLSLQLAACVTTGTPLPDGTPCPRGGVIMIAPEDSPADTIKPRLEAAGGDPSKILLLNSVRALDIQEMCLRDRPFSLAQDLETLEASIQRMHASLVIVDPLMAVLGQTIDSSRDQQVREAFTPLAQLAERTGCAILIIRHLTKGRTSNPLYRGSGSIGIIAAARSGLLIAQDPDHEERRILATTINNLGKTPANLAFEVIENERGVPYLQWHGENYCSVVTLIRGKKQSTTRQDILSALKTSAIPLGPKEIANLSGQDYDLVRKTLERMRSDQEIRYTNRGKYLHLDHPGFDRSKKHHEITEEDWELMSKDDVMFVVKSSKPASEFIGVYLQMAAEEKAATLKQEAEDEQELGDEGDEEDDDGLGDEDEEEQELDEEESKQINVSQLSQSSQTLEHRPHQPLSEAEWRFCREHDLDPATIPGLWYKD